MSNLVTVICCGLPIAAAVIAVIVTWVNGHYFGRGRRAPVQALCIRCHGRGWTQETVRSLDFDGTGFGDTELPAQPCPACGGTGTVLR